jgi:EmrB/QacA subfamily drug resistance transporter
MTAADVEPPVPASAPDHARRTLLIASIAAFAVFLDTTALFVAFPDITTSFPDVAPSQLSWVLNGYTIVFAALLVPLGKLADRRGHKQMFLAGVALFTGASLLCAIAPNPVMLVAARAIQAVGGAALVPSSLALILRSTPRERIPISAAIWGATAALAGAVGPTLGAALVEWGGWRWVFVINLPVGVMTILMGRRSLRESRDPESMLPAPLGVALLVGGSVLLTLGLVRGDDWGWTSAATVGSIVAGLVVLGVFIVHQAHTSAPAMDLSLFESHNFRWANAATIVFGIAFSAMFLSSILFLTSVWKWSILEAGFGVAPGPLLVALLAPRFGKLAARIGQRPLVIVGGLVYAAGGAWRLLTFDADAAFATAYLPSILLTGTGVALCIPQLSSVIGQSLPPNRFGVGGAVNQALRQLGGTLGVALTVGITSGATGIDDALGRFDRIWWMIVAGGVFTTVLSIPLRTGARWTPVGVGTDGAAAADVAVVDAAVVD